LLDRSTLSPESCIVEKRGGAILAGVSQNDLRCAASVSELFVAPRLETQIGVFPVVINPTPENQKPPGKTSLSD
jgi:hypothetical protein